MNKSIKRLMVGLLAMCLLAGSLSTQGFSVRAEEEKELFPDVTPDAWYYGAVKDAVSRGIFGGYKDGRFGPADSIQRQDFLVVLARLEGADLSAYAEKEQSFPDVPQDTYFYSAVTWGAEKGIVTGYQNGFFGTGDRISREQILTFFYRYAKYKGIDVVVTEEEIEACEDKYDDFYKVSPYAVDPVAWALKKGSITGKTDTTVAPQGDASRAEAAQIFLNTDKKDVFVQTDPELLKGYVRDAIGIERRYDENLYDWTWAMNNACYMHVPELSIQTENAKAFNEKIYNTFVPLYEDFLSDIGTYKTEMGYYCDYEYKIYKGLVGIWFQRINEYEGTWSRGIANFYYYDLNEDRELTYGEYLSKLGLTKSEVLSRINERPLIKYGDWGEIYSVTNCIVDTRGTTFRGTNQWGTSVQHLKSILDDAEPGKGIVVDCGNFTVTIPKSWEGNYKYVAYNGYHEYYDFYEKNSYRSEYGGFVKGLWVDDEELDPEDAFGEFSLYKIRKDGKIWYINGDRPTDVQHPAQYTHDYRKMEMYSDELLDSVQLKGSAEFVF